MTALLERARALTRGPDAPGYAFLAAGLGVFVAYQVLWTNPDLPGAHPQVPIGLYALGLVFGALYSLPAMALVLVYRTNRVINFAQGDMGGLATVLGAELILVFQWPYLAGMLVAIAAGVAVSALSELTVVRYFFAAPRLILTVATIGLAQVLGAFELVTPGIFGHLFGRTLPLSYNFPEPFQIAWNWGPVTFTGSSVVALVISPLLALGLVGLLRYTLLGRAIRASSEDLDRARGLGIPAKRLSTLVWILAGLVSAVAGVLSARIYGFSFGVIVGPAFLLRSIAPATVGRFDNLGLTFLAALGLGIVEQGILFDTASGGATDMVLFVIVLGALVFRAPVTGRRSLAESTAYRMLREVRQVPARVAALPEAKLLRVGVPLACLAALVLAPQRLGGYQPSFGQVNLMSDLLIYAMVGASLVLLSGWGGQISLGQWAIAGVGAYAYSGLITHVVHFGAGGLRGAFPDFFASVLLAALAGAAVSVLLGLPSLRIGGYFLAVATLAFAVAADAHIFPYLPVPPALPRPALFGRFNAWDERVFYYAVLAAFLLTLYVVANFRRSRAGRALVAMRDNEVAGASFGFGATGVKLLAFTLAGFIAALAGALEAASQEGARYQNFSAETSLFIFAVVVFGGLGSPVGAALGAALVLGIQFFVGGGYELLASGAGILFMLMLFPGGIGQLVYDARDALLRGIARKHGVDPGALGGEPPPPERAAPAPAHAAVEVAT